MYLDYSVSDLPGRSWGTSPNGIEVELH